MKELKGKPVFSIIIPTYNHAHFINRCLDSVVEQTFQEWEAIVINNFSSDNTVELVEAYNDPRIKLINFRNNGIIASSRNLGIKNAVADWICFLDSDDWWYPQKLEICSKFLSNHCLIYHNLDKYSLKDGIFRRRVGSWKLRDDIFTDLLIRGNAINNSSVVVRKELIISVNCFSEQPELILVEDYDCWLKIAQINRSFLYIPESMGGYWIGSNSSAASERVINAIDCVYKKYLVFLDETNKRKAKSSLSFRIGLLNYAMRRIDIAKKLFTESLFESSIPMKIQCIKFIILCFFRMGRKSIFKEVISGKK